MEQFSRMFGFWHYICHGEYQNCINSMVKYISDRIGVLHLGYMVETGTTEEIFSNPIHPYTKSLLSAIPHPNPQVEKRRKSVTYDYASSGIDYAKGTEHLVEGAHTVLATDEEYRRWVR